MTETEKKEYYENISRLSDVSLLKEFSDVSFDSIYQNHDTYDNLDKVEICKAEILGRML